MKNLKNNPFQPMQRSSSKIPKKIKNNNSKNLTKDAQAMPAQVGEVLTTKNPHPKNNKKNK